MPYPSQITHEQLLQTAARLIEAQGADAITLNAISSELGVKTPSLYRYVKGRTDLLRQLNLHFLNGLIAALSDSADSATPAEQHMLAVMTAYRAYAHEHPQLYLMAFSYMVDELRPDEDLLVQMVLPLQSAMAEIAGQAQSLAALRGIFAYVHGFVMLELNNQLRRGGELAADYQAGARAQLAGWRSPN